MNRLIRIGELMQKCKRLATDIQIFPIRLEQNPSQINIRCGSGGVFASDWETRR